MPGYYKKVVVYGPYGSHTYDYVWVETKADPKETKPAAKSSAETTAKTQPKNTKPKPPVVSKAVLDRARAIAAAAARKQTEKTQQALLMQRAREYQKELLQSRRKIGAPAVYKGDPKLTQQERNAPVMSEMTQRWVEQRNRDENARAAKDYLDNSVIRNKVNGTVLKVNKSGPTHEKALSKIILQAEKDSLSTNGQYVNVDVVKRAGAEYQAYVEKASLDFNKWVDRFLKLGKFADDGSYIPNSEADRKNALELNDNKEWKKVLAEYNRLHDGEAAKTFTRLNNISERQRKYLYNKQKDLLTTRLSNVGGDRNAADALWAQYETERFSPYFAEIAKTEIDETKTGWIWVYDAATGKFTGRQRTVDEEFEVRKAQFRAETQRRYNEYQNQLKLERIQNHQYREQHAEELETTRNVMKAAHAIGISDLQQLKSKGEKGIHELAAKAMEQWERENPRPSTVWKTKTSHDEWRKAREKYFDGIYSYFGMDSPDSSLIGIAGPGIMNVLNSVPGLVGAPLKLGVSVAAGAPSELEFSTGNITKFKLPPAVQRRLTEEARKILEMSFEERFALGYYGGLNRQSANEEYQSSHGSNVDRKRVDEWVLQHSGREWLNTPVGRQWAQAKDIHLGGIGVTQGETPAERARITSEYERAIQLLYSGDGLGSIVEGLGTYGASPFTPDSAGANLVFQVAVDFTNVLPLKFWTIPARVKFIKNVTEEIPGFSRHYNKGPIRALTVTESELRFHKAMETALSDYVKAGGNATELADNTLAVLAGIKDKTLQDKRILDLAKQLGLKKDEKYVTQIRNAIEQELERRLDVKKASAAQRAEALIEFQKTAEKKLADEAAERAAKRAEAKIAAKKAETKGREEIQEPIAQATGRKVQYENAARARKEAEDVRAVKKSVADAKREAKNAKARAKRAEKRAAETAAKKAADDAAAKAAAEPAPVRTNSVGNRLRMKVDAGVFRPRSRFFGKDMEKANRSNKFIGAGVPESSTDDYARILGSDTTFEASDTVWVSANGARGQAKTPDLVPRAEQGSLLSGQSRASTVRRDAALKRLRAQQKKEILAKTDRNMSTAERKKVLAALKKKHDAEVARLKQVSAEREAENISVTQQRLNERQEANRIRVTVGGELTPEYKAVDDAMAAGSTIITDNLEDASRFFNRDGGEWELRDYLMRHGYVEVPPGSGVWKPRTRSVTPDSVAITGIRQEELDFEIAGLARLSDIVVGERVVARPKVGGTSASVSQAPAYKAPSKPDVGAGDETHVHFAEEAKGIPDGEPNSIGWLQDDPDSDVLTLVAYDAKGEPVGIMRAFPPDRDIANEVDYLQTTGEIDASKEVIFDRTIIVRDDARRQGIASRMYDFAESEGYDVTTYSGISTSKRGAAFSQAYKRRNQGPPEVKLAPRADPIANTNNYGERPQGRQANQAMPTPPPRRVLYRKNGSVASERMAARDAKPPKPINPERSRQELLDSLARVLDSVNRGAVLSETQWVDVHRAIAIARQTPEGAAMIAKKADEFGRTAERIRLTKEVPEQAAPPPRPPEAPPVSKIPKQNTPKVVKQTQTQRVLAALVNMNEDQWLAYEYQRAQARFKRARTPEAQALARVRVDDAAAAIKALRQSREGVGWWATAKKRAEYASEIGTKFRDQITQLYPAKFIAPYVHSVAGIAVEEGRSYYNRWRRAVDISNSSSSLKDASGDVSETYTKHKDALEALAHGQGFVRLLEKAGAPPNVARDINIIHLLASRHEFESLLYDDSFVKMFSDLEKSILKDMVRITGDKDYTIEQFLSDRLLVRGDHYDLALYKEHNKLFTDEIARVRGERADLRTRVKRSVEDVPDDMEEGSVRLEAIENDWYVVQAKAKLAEKLGIDIHAYNQARFVLEDVSSQARRAEWIDHLATTEAKATGKTGKAYDKARREAYLRIRREMADEEALAHSEKLASGELFGMKHEDFMAEFEWRYGQHGDIKDIEPRELTKFQMRTLEEAAKKQLGVDDLKDMDSLSKALSAEGQAPPFKNRAKMKEWLVEHGVWSPRKAEQIEEGKASWSIQDEERFFLDNYARVPEWADTSLYRAGDEANGVPPGKLYQMFWDERFHSEMLRRWGFFNRNMEARFATAGYTPEELAQLRVLGDKTLHIKATRSVDQMRRYVKERYGPLAFDGEKLIAFPWLMTRQEKLDFLSTSVRKNLGAGYIDNLEDQIHVNRIIDARLHNLLGKENSLLRKKDWAPDELVQFTDEITMQVMKDVEKYFGRRRDWVGKFLEMQAEIRRGLVFWTLAFGLTNVVDAPLKGALLRVNLRKYLRSGGRISERAKAFTEKQIGFDRMGQFLAETPVHGRARIARANELYPGLEKSMGYVQGVLELPAEVAAKAEIATKMWFARRMYDNVYADFARQFNDPEVIHSQTLLFIQQEITRMWPHVGDGPIEHLFNQLSPFLSYQFKNHVLFIGEALANPWILRTAQKVGDYIEHENRERWENENLERIARGEDPVAFPEEKARQIQLPWTSGDDAVFIDLGILTDATRGWAPLSKALEGKERRPIDWASDWIRVFGPNDINIAFGVLNYLGVHNRWGWRAKLDSEGFQTGEYERVEIPWQAPWGVDANPLNSFWPYELISFVQEKSKGGLTTGEITQIVGKVLLFGGLRGYDKIAGYQEAYNLLKSKNPDAAAEFLLTPQGQELKTSWAERVKDYMIPMTLQEALNNNPYKDWFAQPKEWRDKVEIARDGLTKLMKGWDRYMENLTPGSSEAKAALTEMLTQRYQWYATHPELYENDVYFKSAKDWAETFDLWKDDALTDMFFRQYGDAPQRDSYKSAEQWQEAVAAYKMQKSLFLKANPAVAEKLGKARNALESVWQKTEQGWFDTLDSIGRRSIGLETAEAAQDYDAKEMLYLVQDLQYKTLMKDVAVDYFSESDFVDVKGNPVRAGENDGPQRRLGVSDLLPRWKVLPDFDKWRYARLDEAGKAEFRRDEKFSKIQAELIKKAKSMDGGMKENWVDLVKANPAFKVWYFEKNPGTREKWQAADDYRRLIGRFGELAGQKRWDEAYKYFDRLPAWVKARYYKNKGISKQQAIDNMAYRNWMGRWAKTFNKDYSETKAFFDKMPKWVRDRYLESKGRKHFQNTFNDTTPGSFGSSPYSKAMKKWVDLLKAGKDDEARKYFDSMPKEFQDRYNAKHPQNQLRNDINRTAQLGQYFLADDANRAQFLKDNPEFAKWLHAQGGDDEQRYAMITAAYRALPKDDAWARRVFREKYPEVFSKEAVGERALRKVYKFLAEHPDMLPSFEKWVEAQWAAYAENQKHAGTPPKALTPDHQRRRLGKKDIHGGKSAAWVRLHSLD